jgi:NTE family protein
MRLPPKLLLLAIAALAAACASAPPAPEFAPPRHVPVAQKERAGIALALSGGAARGYAHLGVLKVLEENGLKPDIIVGTSAGAIVGALYASGLSAAQVGEAIAELDRPHLADYSGGFGIFGGSTGLLRGERLRAYVDAKARSRDIEAFPIRFAAVATHLANGEPQVFNAGDVGTAVRASCAVPGLFMPVEIAGKRFIDGQLSSPVPVDAARLLGARFVIAVDVIYPPEDAAPRSALDVILQSFLITVHRLRSAGATQADLVIAPELGHTSGQFSFQDREHLAAAGERAAREALGAIRILFTQARAKPVGE